MSQDLARLPQVLEASVQDVRYFASLLRGVHFSNQMATITLTETGLTVTVEEARTLVAVAFIFSQVFDDFDVKRPKRTRRRRRSPKMLVPNSDTEDEDELDDPRARQHAGSQDVDEEDDDGGEDEEVEVVPGNYTIAFQINLNVLIDCLNIFGTAGPVTAPSAASHKKFTRQAQGGGDGEDQNQNPNRNEGVGDGNDTDGGEGGARRNGGGGGAGAGQRTLQPVSLGGQTNAEKKTSVRMAYAGDGYPLQLIVTEEDGGPTTTCEITTYQTEPHLSLEIGNDGVILRIILKSSWFRDALSEIDPSCEKLTFIANPPPDNNTRRRPGEQNQPRLRIQADGTFGSTEMDYPSDKEVLETFDCMQKIVFSYRYSHIIKTLRALSSSTKTSMRIDEDGLLSLQFLMPKPRSNSADPEGFVEFRFLALNE